MLWLCHASLSHDIGEPLPYFFREFAPYGVDPYGWVLLPGFYLPSWTNAGRVNCYTYDGNQELDEGMEKTSLADCLLYCLGDPEGICDAVTVEWIDITTGFVKCYKRSNIDFDYCDDTSQVDDGESTFSTFYVNFE